MDVKEKIENGIGEIVNRIEVQEVTDTIKGDDQIIFRSDRDMTTHLVTVLLIVVWCSVSHRIAVCPMTRMTRII